MAIVTGEEIHAAALACGFDNCGIVPLSDLAGYGERLAERMEKVPMSSMMYNAFKGFAHPQDAFPWGKAAVVTMLWFGKYRFPKSLRGHYGKAFLLSQETEPSCRDRQGMLQFRQWMTDHGIRWEGGESYGPSRNLPLRYAAVKAGLGIFRQNNFFYGPKGSWYELEGYIIDQDVIYKEDPNVRPCPPKCGLCRKACPSGTLSEAYTMNPFACVSFTTTFGDGKPIPPSTLEQVGEWICGCDACQDACPFNRRHDWDEGGDFLGLPEITELLSPEGLLAASDEDLKKNVIPKTVNHLRDDQTDLLRRMAKNCIDHRERSVAE